MAWSIELCSLNLNGIRHKAPILAIIYNGGGGVCTCY